MAGSAQRPIAKRDRVRLSIDGALVAWLRERTDQGTFGGDSHAVELALRRLRAEQEFIRDACKRQGIPYSTAAFWQLHQAELEQSVPNEAGRPGRGNAGRPLGQRERLYASVEQGLLEWVGKHAGGKGPFENASHAVETGLRCLHHQEPKAPATVPALGFQFDADAVLGRYREIAARRGRTRA